MIPDEKVCQPCRSHGKDRAAFRVVDGVRLCGGCVADMPVWCAPCLRKEPQQFVHGRYFRDGLNLCKECFEELHPELATTKKDPPPILTTQPIPEFVLKMTKLESVPESGPAVVPEDKPQGESDMAKLCKGGCGTKVNSRFDYAYGHKGGCPGKTAASVSTPAKAALKVNRGEDGSGEQSTLGTVIHALKAKRDKLTETIEQLEAINAEL